MIVHVGRHEVLSQGFFRGRRKSAQLAFFEPVCRFGVAPLHVNCDVRFHAGLVIARVALPIPYLPVSGIAVFCQRVFPPRREVALIARETSSLPLVDPLDVLLQAVLLRGGVAALVADEAPLPFVNSSHVPP